MGDFPVRWAEFTVRWAQFAVTWAELSVCCVGRVSQYLSRLHLFSYLAWEFDLGSHNLYSVYTCTYSLRVFEDKHVTMNSEYTYEIAALVDDVSGVASSPFQYSHTTGYCGNRELDRYAITWPHIYNLFDIILWS